MRTVSVLVIGTAILVSMRVGLRHLRSTAWKWGSILLTVAGVVAGFILLSDVGNRLQYGYWNDVYEPSYVQYDPPMTNEEIWQFEQERLISEGILDAPITTTSRSVPQ